MKTVVIAAAFLFVGAAAPAAWADSVSAQPGAQNEQMHEASSRHRHWHRRWHRPVSVCTTHWRHGRRVTVCRWR